MTTMTQARTRALATAAFATATALGAGGTLAEGAAPTVTWDRQFHDLGGARLDLPEADLVLPLPCGGAMGFQKVMVSADADDPVADRVVRVGQTGTSFGYMDSLRRDFLRGAFSSHDSGSTYYYIGRYELTELQYAALTDPDCGTTPKITGLLPRLNLSWFEAVDLARRYTEWLMAAAPDAMPRADGQAGFLRLPTEVEWEFAARGGEAVDPLDYNAPRPMMSETADQLAQFEQTGPAPAGAHAPNPLMLFDMLGNAEELMLEPFRLNAVARTHGQGGGVVTRGGSYHSTEADMRSARRSEWPPYNPRSGAAQRQDSFGVRFVISAPVMTGDARVDEIGTAWARAMTETGTGEAEQLPVAELAGVIEGEDDPERRSALEDLQLSLTEAKTAEDQAARERLDATLVMATVANATIRLQDRRRTGVTDYLEHLETTLEEITAEDAAGDPELIERNRENIRLTMDDLRQKLIEVEESLHNLVGSYREALTILADADPARRDEAFVLHLERLEARGDTGQSEAAALLRDDIPAFAATPDMTYDMLLDLARSAT
ncbi:SUMF1/EgtB/PvdO family nonheme iron enzyme [uncultured Limimaricola sp.]|uniref:formylglycine-generating enzyme family protein n=1 Tax=uncultured Limimaricola sp. TaxID=2211667 RepID=UPI0030FD1776